MLMIVFANRLALGRRSFNVIVKLLRHQKELGWRALATAFNASDRNAPDLAQGRGVNGVLVPAS
jgi:hypothetical protein